MGLDELYSKWYDNNKTDITHALICWNLLQQINYRNLCWDAKIKYDQLYNGITYAMEDYLHDNYK